MADSMFFFKEVQKYDCLYNKFSKDYRDWFMKLNCWTKIAQKFDINPSKAEKNFKNLRTAYGLFLKKKKKIPLGSRREAEGIFQCET